MAKLPDDDPFHDCKLDPEAILGTHTCENILFTGETRTPVNVLAGKTPARSQATIKEAEGFAVSVGTEAPQVALPASIESQIETQNRPYTAAIFLHFKATGSLERHRIYHAVCKADTFAVDFEVDYASGDLTVIID